MSQANSRQQSPVRSTQPSPVHTPIHTPVGVTPPQGETEVRRTVRIRSYVPDFLCEPEETVVDQEGEAVGLAARLAATQGKPSLPNNYGIYTLLKRKVPEYVQWPGDNVIQEKLSEGVDQDLNDVRDELTIGWNAVTQAVDIGTTYADLSTHTLRRQLDGRFKRMFQVADIQNTYIKHLEERIATLERGAGSTGTAGLFGASTSVSQTAMDLMEARLRKLEKQPAAVSSAQALTSLEAKVKQLEAQLAAKPASTATTAAGQTITIRQPVEKPPTFSGDEKSTPVKEWLQKLSMYFADAGIVSEREQIVKALRTLTGVAFQYQEARIAKARDPTQDLGTWKEFEDQMTNTYGKKSQEEIARKEIEGYFGDEGKKKAKADFFKYAGRLRVLQSHAKTDNKTMLEKLKDVLPEKVTDAFALMEVMAVGQMPTDWDKYLDKAIELYKISYRKELTGSIFPDDKSKAPEASKKTSTNHITTSATSAPAKATSGSTPTTTKPLPAGAQAGAYWYNIPKTTRWVLRAPPHKCNSCKRDNCTNGFPECKSKPAGQGPHAAPAKATITTTTSGSQPQGKGRYVRTVTEWIPEGEADTAPAPAAATVSAAFITEEPPSPRIIDDRSLPSERHSPASDLINPDFFYGRM